jgi:C-terminal processing protease CtpA/Prc
VTILGTASGGGSGRSRPARLAHSGIGLRLSSMASFQPDGRLYDGRGVEPDVVVATAPTDHTLATDTVLDAALAFLRRR